MAKKSDRARAMVSPHLHAFVAGRGYIEIGEPELSWPREHKPIKPRGEALCRPSEDAVNMSEHLLMAATGGAPIAFKWLSDQAAWLAFPRPAIRMAFRPDYLAAEGWVYIGPAP